MATIKDVAKRAGVSISTVSYVLNNTGKISEETRERVLKAIKELNYTPNSFAKKLKKQTYDLVALIVHEINGPFYDALVRGIQDVLHTAGYNLLIYCTLETRRGDVEKFLNTGVVNGFIVLTNAVRNEEILGWAERFKIVTLDRILRDQRVKSVTINNEKGAHEVVNFLFERGHRHIGFIKGPRDSLDAKERFKGFTDAMKHLGLEVKADEVLEGNFTVESGYDAMIKFLSSRRKKDLPTAFFAANDEMAIGAMNALKEVGLSIPQDVSLVGFDDIELASYVQPKLTTVRRPMYQLGSFAAHMLLNLLQERDVEISNVVLDVNLVIRDSVRDLERNKDKLSRT